ncbi:MAG: MgtC/SapB family protein [Acidobacteria bacterium]|nr:MgtC/SapB family protein [Acidobacteriota bacterium]MBU4307012.1 MgtC/SapB family protein [Acidobacteriota bacterium]MBU4404247.1 MgtC/SapB family protein [Acidobacteriota bacterium]MCG2812804.1 MgtC/SapB family protein [Candidatus Aminicenantes bacterium]
MEIDIILKILLAAMLGGIIGLERELSHKEAGLRTNILIAIGSALITILSFKIAALSKTADPARLTAQIVSGIGFLGAGAIIQARFAVHGLTTAATIWTVAAIGIAVGSGFYLVAFLVTIFVVLVLTVFKFLQAYLEKQKQNYIYLISTEEKASLLVDVRQVLTELNIRYSSARLNRKESGYEFEIIFNTSENKNRDFIEKIMLIKGVKEILSENL